MPYPTPNCIRAGLQICCPARMNQEISSTPDQTGFLPGKGSHWDGWWAPGLSYIWHADCKSTTFIHCSALENTACTVWVLSSYVLSHKNDTKLWLYCLHYKVKNENKIIYIPPITKPNLTYLQIHFKQYPVCTRVVSKVS